MTGQGADILRSRIAELEGRLQELLREHETLRTRFSAQKSETDESLKRADAQFKAQREARRRELAERSARSRQAIDGREARDLARIERAHSNAASRAEVNSASESERLVREKQETIDRAVRELKEKNAHLFREPAAAQAELEELRQDSRELAEGIAAVASRLKIRLKAPPPAENSLAPEKVLGALKARLADTQKRLVARRGGIRVRLARLSPRFLALAGLILLAHGAGLLAIWKLDPQRFQTVLTFVAPVTLLSSLSLAVLFCNWMKQSAYSVVDPLQAGLADLEGLLERHAEGLAQREKANHEKLLQKKIDRISEIEEKFRALEGQAGRTAATRIEILTEQRDALIGKAGRRKERRLAQEAASFEREKKALDEREAEEIARRQKPESERKKEAADRERAELATLATRWKRVIDDFREMSREACRRSRERRPDWTLPPEQGLKKAAEFPDAVFLGDVSFGWDALAGPSASEPVPFRTEAESVAWPLDLCYPEQGNLLMSMDSATRETALKGLFSTLLRILCSFPPGKAKFTLFDPVGLGQNFAALMHLADYEESLVGGRIWTETAHFERKLAELTEHVEKVIQKYLRNRYATIGAYNREVSEMAEAYRFLVIADFPTGFSDLALERLASLLTSGARCGVHVLILWDRAQRWPAALNLARFKATGLIVRAEADGFVVEDEKLQRGRLTLERPPPPDALTSLLHAVGRECADAGRVELSFETVAPGKDRLWAESAESGIRIPLGRAGADRLQLLELGRGTAQHALIAGKTGSGKSTLFHVMVTSSALWYAPRELELYLIDFKKGVEFKTYAVHGLPHARAIAIESDREFGLSVLSRIDKELTFRAEQFRKKGVQDFAGYRKAEKAEVLPRTLLMIDEFQEFFTEEDAIAQDAALLLDRIVRQGRAFGVHVILGSQTLGGSYTLARTTLGQMAVRIALQCNEADSYLILNDDNAAARLLSRPGEAIYNNMSGMVEGNNPFQVAWLPDEVRDRLLQDVSAKAGREKAGAREPMVTFEGNVPADIRNNLFLKERLAHPAPPDDGGLTAWIGEANAIKGPTEVRFKNEGGSNLLLVGQQRESALSVIASAVYSLASAAPAPHSRFVILDGSPPEAPGRRLADLLKTIPHDVDVVEYARVPEVMEALAAEVTGRLEGTRPADRRIFLIVYDLQRFRQLRQRDEFEYSGGGEKKPSADRHFGTLLSEGPPQRIHSVVWSDSLNNLNRTLHRKALGEFQMRILFQMSAADSSELIDLPLAGKLGLYRGLLFLEEHGTVEKFRPYSLPDPDTLENFRQALHAASVRAPHGSGNRPS